MECRPGRRFAEAPTEYGRIIEAIDAGLQARATNAEMKSAGAGLALIVAELARGQRRETEQ